MRAASIPVRVAPVPRPFYVTARGPLGVAGLAPFLIGAALSPLHAADGSWLELTLQISGWLFFLAGGLCRFWATLYIGARKGQALATDGPYSVCRNPLYFGNFLLLIAFICFVQSITFALGALCVALAYLHVTIGSEEERLTRKFGDAYRAYCAVCPRFWPNWSRFQTPAEITVSVRGLALELWNARLWILVLLGGALLERLRSAQILPVVFNLP